MEVFFSSLMYSQIKWILEQENKIDYFFFILFLELLTLVPFLNVICSLILKKDKKK